MWRQPQANFEAKAFYPALEEYSECGCLRATWFELEECQRPIGRFRADVVPVVPLRNSAGEVKVYPTKKRGLSRYPVKRKRLCAGDGQRLDENAINEGGLNAEGDPGSDDDLPEDVDPLHDEFPVGDQQIAGLSDDVLGALMEPASMPPDEGEPPQQGPPPPAPLRIDPPPVLAPGPPPRQGPGSSRDKGLNMVVLTWGKISFYRSKRVFEATCRNPAHGKCVLTRTSGPPAGSSAPSNRRAGRPVGFLAAWLAKGGVSSKEEHWSPDVLQSSLQARRAARRLVMSLPNGPELLLLERPKADGEASEPENLDGYM